MINVIIPAYNCNETIEKSLYSLASQTNSNFITTIIDDCSTQDLTPIVNKFEKILNLRYIRRESNGGCGMARQTGIDNTECEWFCFLDADDMFLPYTIDVFYNAITANPNTDFLTSIFYTQVGGNDGRQHYILQGFYDTWCHGKLYNTEKIKKLGIKNNPQIRWADDSYFNSMVSTLLVERYIDTPTYLWCNNTASITRNKSSEFHQKKREDFLLGMKLSVEFLQQFDLKRIPFIHGTLESIDRNDLSSVEQEYYDYLRKVEEKYGNTD